MGDTRKYTIHYYYKKQICKESLSVLEISSTITHFVEGITVESTTA